MSPDSAIAKPRHYKSLQSLDSTSVEAYERHRTLMGVPENLGWGPYNKDPTNPLIETSTTKPQTLSQATVLRAQGLLDLLSGQEDCGST